MLSIAISGLMVATYRCLYNIVSVLITAGVVDAVVVRLVISWRGSLSLFLDIVASVRILAVILGLPLVPAVYILDMATPDIVTYLVLFMAVGAGWGID